MQEITFTSNQIMIYTLTMIPIAMSCVYAGYLVGLKVGKNITFFEFAATCQRPMFFYNRDKTHPIKKIMYGPKCKDVSCDYIDDLKNCHILKEQKAKNIKCGYLL